MAVVVHANFPDSAEVDNGVAIFTILPSGSQHLRTPSGYVLEVNQQAGAHSVTNPPPGSPHLPEIDRVTVVGDGAPVIERLRGSTILLPGDLVLNDAALLAMFDDARTLTEQWLANDNAELSASKRRSTLTLDFETRTVAPGWPALRSGIQQPQRLVWKQARPLEPASHVPASIGASPIPRDVLARIRRVEEHRCSINGLAVLFAGVFTDAGIAPDMGFDKDPFVSFFIVDVLAPQPAIDAVTPQQRSAVHSAYSSVKWGADDVVIDVDPTRTATLKLEQIRIPRGDSGTLAVRFGGEVSGAASCTTTTSYAGAADFLDALLAAVP